MNDRCIFFFDFDNTLYSHQSKRIPPSALDALERLRQQGHLVVLISGRGNESFPMFAREFRKLPDIVCLLNGQIIYHRGELVFERRIPGLDIRTLFEKAKQQNFIYGGYNFEGLVISGIDARVRTVWADFHGEIPPVKAAFETTDPVYQACLYITQEEQTLFGSMLDAYVTNWSHPYLCNLISKKAGKSQSIRWCLEHFGIRRENAYAFGDGYNDMDMLEAVPHSVAMENGFEPLKKIAEYVAPAPDQDGIFTALRHYGFLP